MPSYERVIRLVIPHIEHHQNRYARGLADAVPPGCRWLDLGAGTRLHHGWVGPTERELVQRARMLVGCDVVVEHLRQNQLQNFAVGAEAGHLPFRDSSFDVVSANMVLEHLERPETVFAEVARVLSPGGRFVFVTPNRHNPVVGLASLLLSRPMRKALARWAENRAPEHIFHTYYRANTIGDVLRLARPLPFRPRTLELFNSFPYARKPWPLTAVESLWIRAIQRPYLRAICSNLLGDLERI